MSLNNSGSSTPTPPPAGDGPSPLTVGTHFVKKYYHNLSTNPDDVVRMYQPASTFSVGVGSEPAQPESFEVLQGQLLKERFFQEGFEAWNIRFEFENGAIDAQLSVNGGILLVATGHVVYMPPMNGDDGNEDSAIVQQQQQRRKGFVHTFFLRSMVVGGNKKTFSIQNDILRFLQDDEEKTVIASNTTSGAGHVDAGELLPTEPSVQLPTTVQEPPLSEVIPSTDQIMHNNIPVKPAETNDVDTAPGGGVEETKEPLFEEEDHLQFVEQVDKKIAEPVEEQPVVADHLAGEEAAILEPPKEEITTNGSRLEPMIASEEHALSDAGTTKPPPGSWASLVASSGKGSAAQPTSSTPSTPARSNVTGPKPTSSSPAQPKPSYPSSTDPVTNGTISNSNNNNDENNPTTNTNNNKQENSNRQQRMGKRNPDSTLVIKNVSAETTESEVRETFEPFANEIGAKVFGLTVSASRGIAFVDYDSPKPVLAAIEKAKEDPIELNGRMLEIYQKTADQQNRRRNQGGGRGFYRGGQPGSSRPYRRSSSGTGRGGDRGGGGRGGRGGRA